MKILLSIAIILATFSGYSQSPSFQKHLDAANILIMDNDFQGAVSELTEALKYGENSQIYYKLAKSCYELDQYQNSLASLNKCISLDPTHADAYFLRANIHVELNDTYTAINDYTSSIILDPNNIYAYLQRAFTFSEIGFQEEVIRDMAIAIQINETDAKAFYNMAKISGIIQEKEVCMVLPDMLAANNTHAELVKNIFCL